MQKNWRKKFKRIFLFSNRVYGNKISDHVLIYEFLFRGFPIQIAHGLGTVIGRNKQLLASNDTIAQQVLQNRDNLFVVSFPCITDIHKYQQVLEETHVRKSDPVPSQAMDPDMGSHAP
jgi:hypothetical protein